jgi:plastocyanin
MRNRIWVIFSLVALFIAACGSTKSVAEPVLTAPAISVQITEDYCPSVEIKAGAQIAWTNADFADRALWLERRDEQGVLIDSGGTDLLQPGTTFTIILTIPGQYTYYCSIDHTASGTITVSP